MRDRIKQPALYLMSALLLTAVTVTSLGARVSAQTSGGSTPGSSQPSTQTNTTTTTSTKDAVCEGIGATAGTNDCTAPAGSTDVKSVVATVVNILSIIAGVAAVIMIIIGGLRYITSGGDSSSVSAAKKTIIYAIVGLIVVALAQAIVRFTITKLQ